jgi:uncharacterized protein HemX|tara:strand:+ start:122 stop:502 length:381 start_codon:yes stop_codon:yes gene_type:complete
MSKIFIGIILTLVLAFGGYYWMSERKIDRLTENNASLTIAATTNQETIEKMTENNAASQLAIDELNIKLKVSEQYGDALQKKLREHNLTMLTLRKPGLIESRVNNATQELFDDFESSTATTADKPE